MLKHLPLFHPRREAYEEALVHTLRSLSERYTTWNMPDADGLLLHAL